jgi:hypothetical protein
MPPKTNEPSIRSEIVAAATFFAVMLLPMRLAEPASERVSRLLHFGDSYPGDEPPWYFIHEGFLDGVGSLVVFLVTLLLILATWKLLKRYALMSIWMSWISQGGSILKSWIIYRSCPGLLGSGSPTTSWTTFDSYLHDQSIAHAHSFVLWTAMILAIGFPCISLLKDGYQRCANIKEAEQVGVPNDR